ncbi:RNA polymerase subunit sigma [Amycolatopsis sp. WAC 01376]|uniref:sigma-70 family RNA polymerase sigma factor n=1 Tax=Amycolatopsis sp. WAC 01376 TaxID=2203195 RepID=UPI000F79BE3A|nr:sigma-70 family RNA polymerase sigma factor [Amycolatopsis sp. WAC 01376]RSM52587.1 RNA polymerase subunit sigma [Amycolatopsis sp. WAC 01376]
MRDDAGQDAVDATLLDAFRAGDIAAGEALFRRHAEPLRRIAAGWVAEPAERDDLVAEAFVRVLSVIRAGGGPRENLRPYLAVTIRNLAAKWSHHHKRVELYGTTPAVEQAAGAVDAEELLISRSNARLAWRAYCALPGRWRTVLWRTEAEGDSPKVVAPLLGVSPNGASVLALRAREGLRQAFLQAQVPDAGTPCCREARRRMGAWLRGGVPGRRADLIAAHLVDCEPCRTVATRLDEINREMPPGVRAVSA